VPEEPLGGDADAIAAYVRAVYETGFADPLNPARCYPTAALMSLGAGGPAPPPEKWQSVLTLPAAPPYPWHDEPPRRGRVEHRVVASRRLGNSRTVTLWQPPGAAAERLPLVVLLDGESFLLGMDAPRIFDNLVAGGHVRPFAAVLVHNATPSSRVSEYPCHQGFPDFLADELLPKLGLAPGDAVVGGYSLGGLAACWAAYARPDVFGSVLALSASLWWGPEGEPEWLTRRLATAELTQLRFWIEVGSLEHAPLAETDGLTMLAVARRLRDTVRASGHVLAGYRERPGGHDFVNWRRGLPEGLAALLGAGRAAEA
jgi:enterochelin esterase family protein